MSEERYVIALRGEAESSDQPFKEELKPTEKSKVIGPIKFASVVLIECESAQEAKEAFRAAYPGRANTTLLTSTKANLA